MKRVGWCLFITLLHWLPLGCAAGEAELTGWVVDADGLAVEGATVRLQGTLLAARSDAKGAFRLRAPTNHGAPAVAASRPGYFNAGSPLEAGRSQYKITLTALPTEDHAGYAFIASSTSPDPGDARAPCLQCHPDHVNEWRQSSHSTSATNPLFLAVLTGHGEDGQPTGGPGYRLDFPGAQGNCAACHLPVMAVRAPFHSDPTEAQGVAKEGVTCDFCHKIRGARVDETGGRPGVLSIDFLRPGAGRDVFLGSLDDVIGRPDAFEPLYRESRYCAPCHQGTFWNVRAYSEFEEWAASGYAQRGVQCQDCHMNAAKGERRRIAPEREGAILRDPATLSSHLQRGVRDLAFMRSAVELKADAALANDEVVVRTSVRNAAAGHHVPTGSPMRNMVLLVQVLDGTGVPLAQVAGDRVPEWAGVGAPADGHYAGLAGKGYAKVLTDVIEYPADRARGRQFSPMVPAPFWRPTLVASDTRIPAEAIDRSEYRFRRPSSIDSAGPLTMRVRLIYRRTFRSWDKLEPFAGEELELAKLETIMGPSHGGGSR